MVVVDAQEQHGQANAKAFFRTDQRLKHQPSGRFERDLAGGDSARAVIGSVGVGGISSHFH